MHHSYAPQFPGDGRRPGSCRDKGCRGDRRRGGPQSHGLDWIRHERIDRVSSSEPRRSTMRKTSALAPKLPA